MYSPRMIVRHVPMQADPATSSAECKVWLYRTEVENDSDRPIRVIWFQFHYKDEHHGGDWFGVNIRNRPLRNPDFVDWYGDAGNLKDGWLQPGQVAACDPNYHFAFGEEVTPVKWSFIAVDSDGNDELAEALVEQSAVTLYDPEKGKQE